MRVQVIVSAPESKDTSQGHLSVDEHVDCCADQTYYLA